MKRSVLLLLFFLGCSKATPTDATPAGDAGDTDGGAGEGGSAGSQCTAARESTLHPIDKVSTGAVSIVSDDGTVRVLYVDASAGGLPNASKNPAVYVNFETGTKVEVTDQSSLSSTDWDLALKRTVLYTNGGDGGPGSGGAGRLDKAFADVASADGVKIESEKFFDADCNPILDQASYLTTTFSPDWYSYDTSTQVVTPVPNVTYLVVGGSGKQYKVAIESYKGKPDGTSTAPAGGYFLLRVAPL
jgi:hypothetical protein